MELTDFESKELNQSHTFVIFPFGTPYAFLGWEKYRQFNKILNDYLRDSGNLLKIRFYIHEHEVIGIEGCFVWVISFFDDDINKQTLISNTLIKDLKTLINYFYMQDAKEVIITNNKSDDFSEALTYIQTPELIGYYVELIELGEKYIQLKDIPKPEEKTFKMPLPDMDIFRGQLTVKNFVKNIDEYLYGSSITLRHEMIFASDGYWSTKYPELKFLREELVPLKKFIEKFEISQEDSLHLGFERLTYDACIQSADKSNETIIEITSALPEEDHLLLSLFSQSWNLIFPVKNQHKLKKYKDSITEKIIKAIDKKHKKNYSPGRVLIVILPSEYVYQGEDYILDEIINEVIMNCSRGIGNFSSIFLLCDGKFKVIFSWNIQTRA
ncbi:hypothetical protein XJ06_003699 [Salmonella enterica subsp. enterica]|nr:hypothetical protein [Salmonella enterica subsp. enterica]